jgi:M6 family metalloprotease-like protein
VAVAALRVSSLTQVEDVSGTTGTDLFGQPTAWTHIDGSAVVEHVAGHTSSREVVVFSRRGGRWTVVNASREAGSRAAVGPLTSWTAGSGAKTVGHVAGVGPRGDLLVFWWSPRVGKWRLVNASAEAGQRLAAGSALTSWVTQAGTFTVEHVAGVGPAGELTVFWWSPRTGRWQSVNASAEAVRRLGGGSALTSWVTQAGEFKVEHVAGVGPAGELTVYWWSRRTGRWQSVNASQEAGHRLRLGPGLANWVTQSGDFTVEHLAGAGSADELLVFWWSRRVGHWQALDVARRAGGTAVSVSDAFPRGTGDRSEVLFGRAAQGGLVTFWWRSALDWQLVDLGSSTGTSISADPVAWQLASGEERVAAAAATGHLLVYTGRGQERALTDAVRQPYKTLKRMRGVRRQVLLILWDPHKPDVARPARSVVEAAVFGATNSVRSYFLENSGGQYTIERAGVLGWYDSDYPPSEYWPGGGRVGRDSGAEAIRKAARDIDFRRFEADRDGALPAAELGVLFVLPGKGDGGGLNRTVGEDFQDRSEARGITVDGVKITSIAEVSIGAPPGPGIIAHELSHLLLGHGDMYFTFFNPAAAGMYSIMDQDGQAPHLDPFAKLKLGWLRPRLIFRSGTYRLADVETDCTGWILLDPRRNTQEYFIVENRWPGTSFDRVLPDRGLAVWHIMEDPATYNAALPPPNTDAEKWRAIDGGGFTRKGIRMIRPVQTAPFNNARALWDGTDPVTGYDLLSDDAVQSHAELRWGDGSPSGFEVRDFGAPGVVVEARLTAPWTPRRTVVPPGPRRLPPGPRRAQD